MYEIIVYYYFSSTRFVSVIVIINQITFRLLLVIVNVNVIAGQYATSHCKQLLVMFM